MTDTFQLKDLNMDFLKEPISVPMLCINKSKQKLKIKVFIITGHWNRTFKPIISTQPILERLQLDNIHDRAIFNIMDELERRANETVQNLIRTQNLQNDVTQLYGRTYNYSIGYTYDANNPPT